MKYVWIVEMKNEFNERWGPTVGAAPNERSEP